MIFGIVEDSVMENSLVYFMITAISYPFLALFSAGAAFLQGIGLMTIVGQCIGADRKEEAKYYIVKLMYIAGNGTLVSCLLVLAITKPVTWLAGMEAEAAQMCFELVVAMTIIKPFVWVDAFGLPYGLRAAGDVFMILKLDH